MRLKYMGSADVRVIGAGADFGGRLATPLAKEIRWDRSNNWVVDTEKEEIPNEVASLLAQEPGFLDVSGQEIVPVNDHQKIFMAMTDVAPAENPALVETPAAEPVQGTVAAPRAGRAGGTGTTPTPDTTV